MKNCIRCGFDKSRNEFSKDKKRKDGLYPYCKTCVALYAKSWREANKEAIKKKQAAWVKANPEKNAKKRREWIAANREQERANRQAWRKANPDKVKATERKVRLKRYGLTPEQYDSLLSVQGGVCACCGTDDPKGRNKVFSVDHCHVTGKIRGLLCSPCNAAIGGLGDSLEGVQQALDYLSRPEVDISTLSVLE